MKEFKGSEEMKKILVVYHSRSGYTSGIAREIARLCNADVEAVNDLRGYGKGAGYLRSILEAAFHTVTLNRPVKNAAQDYELVIIGTPIWCWNISSPVRSYIESNRKKLKNVAFFCTYGGSGQEKVLQDMAALAGQPAAATMGVSDREIDRNMHHEKIATFIQHLGQDRNVQPLKASISPVAVSK
jgi:flavodoxin